MAWTDPTTRETGHTLTAAQWNSDIVDNIIYLLLLVEPTLTNNSGGSVAVGDVVIVDSSADSSFTTTTTANNELVYGVATESILNGQGGRVNTRGVVTINVTGSVTRGDYLITSTTAKLAKSTGTLQSRGSFALALTGDSGGSCTGLLLSSARGFKIPQNSIFYTTDASAPDGYSEYTGGRGRAIVGLVSGGTNAGTVATALTDQESSSHTHSYSAIAKHQHYLQVKNSSTSVGSTSIAAYDNSGTATTTTYTSSSSGNSPPQTTGASFGTGSPQTHLMPYIQLLCIKRD